MLRQELQLNTYYIHTTTHFPSHRFEVHLNNKADLYVGHLFIEKIRGYFLQRKTNTDESNRFDFYGT